MRLGRTRPDPPIGVHYLWSGMGIYRPRPVRKLPLRLSGTTPRDALLDLAHLLDQDFLFCQIFERMVAP